MRPPVDPGARLLRRFTLAERLVHWATAILVLVCIATGTILYNGGIGIAVGHRNVVEMIHVYCGLALPAPMLLGLVSVAYRADLGRLNRFGPSDWRWLRSRHRRDGTIGVGKFNAGQKLNSALSAGSILVLFGTGIVMYFTHLVRLSLRTGATFVHDWFALAFGLLVAGHLYYAIRDPESRRGMRTGSVLEQWGRAEHAAWVDEITGETGENNNKISN
jgi:formate dehydrogenase subunit gamma